MFSTITVRGLSLQFPNGRELFQNLSFSLGAEVSALVGPNGIGKTSLARLLAGELEPGSGAVLRHSPVRLFPQRQPPPAVTVSDYLESSGYTWSLAAERLLGPVPRSTPCDRLSGGQWMRVRLAAALDEGFLILDEPTNDLDREGRQAILRFLSEHRGGVLLISHDRECLRRCRAILELSRHGLDCHGAGWEAYLEHKQAEQDRGQVALELAQRKREQARAERVDRLERQEKRNRQGERVAARGGIPPILAGGRKRQAQATTGRIQATTLQRADQAVSDAFQAFNQLKVDPVMYADLCGQSLPAGKLVAEASGFNIRFDRWLYPYDLNFHWRGNVRVALQGANGSGKTSLLQAILGQNLATRGQLRRGRLATLYLDQRCAGLDDDRSLIDNVRAVSAHTDTQIRNALAQFLFAKETVFQKAGQLSGGERLRAALARGLLSAAKPELLILDEPTNNLDLANITFLENLVREFRGALIVISHDATFLERCGIDEELVVDAPINDLDRA